MNHINFVKLKKLFLVCNGHFIKKYGWDGTLWCLKKKFKYRTYVWYTLHWTLILY